MPIDVIEMLSDSGAIAYSSQMQRAQTAKRSGLVQFSQKMG